MLYPITRRPSIAACQRSSLCRYRADRPGIIAVPPTDVPDVLEEAGALGDAPDRHHRGFGRTGRSGVQVRPSCSRLLDARDADRRPECLAW